MQTAPPSWMIEPESKIVGIHSNITWTCTVSGIPVPFVKWQKETSQ
jgi:hypothetical protein